LASKERLEKTTSKQDWNGVLFGVNGHPKDDHATTRMVTSAGNFVDYHGSKNCGLTSLSFEELHPR
jgi:hypothetical protein